MYGMGVAAADYDNDGQVDVYLTGLGGNRLFRNLGGGTFADVTAEAGVADGGFATSAAFFDYDKDGKLDLFVGQLRRVVDRQGPLLHARRHAPSPTARPSRTRARAPRLYRNRGDGTFEDVTQKAGLLEPDVEGARRRPARLRRRRLARPLRSPTTPSPTSSTATAATAPSPTSGVAAGVAFSEAGVARAGMGVDAADYDGSGRPSLVIGNFSNEMMALYHNEGHRPLHRRGARLGRRPAPRC